MDAPFLPSLVFQSGLEGDSYARGGERPCCGNGKTPTLSLPRWGRVVIAGPSPAGEGSDCGFLPRWGRGPFAGGGR